MNPGRCQYLLNRKAGKPTTVDPVVREAFASDDISSLHRLLPGYEPTPLVELPALAKHLGLGRLLVKDESERFSLKAFKVLGASYALFRFLSRLCYPKTSHPLRPSDLFGPKSKPLFEDFTVCTATDGNHGRALAWTARLFGLKAVIFMPERSAPARIDAIRREGAEVVIVEGSYDEAVCKADLEAPRNGWRLIADTSYGEYKQIPAWVMAGYLTLLREIETDLEAYGVPSVSHVFVQSGVGSLAATVAWHFRSGLSSYTPVIISVEPTEAACLLTSAKRDKLSGADGSLTTIMAGLNCGTPSRLAWPILRDTVDLFLAIPDEYARQAVRIFHSPSGNDRAVESGESGAAGLGALLALRSDNSLKDVRTAIGLNTDSTVLLINTEGATDPDGIRNIIADRT